MLHQKCSFSITACKSLALWMEKGQTPNLKIERSSVFHPESTELRSHRVPQLPFRRRPLGEPTWYNGLYHAYAILTPYLFWFVCLAFLLRPDALPVAIILLARFVETRGG